jgi:hypothetical protein
VYFGNDPVTIGRFRVQLDNELGLVVNREKEPLDVVPLND